LAQAKKSSVVPAVGSSRLESWRKIPEVEQFATVRDIRQQYVHERVLAVERRPALVFLLDNPVDHREVKLSEHIVLLAEQTSSLLFALCRIDPVIHD